MKYLFALVLALFAGMLPAEASEPQMMVLSQPLEPPSLPAPPGGWWKEDGLYLQVFSAVGDRKVATNLARAGNELLPGLSERLGLPIGAMVEVYLAPTQEDFNNLQPGTPPDWADGTAWPLQGLVFLRAPSLRPGTAEPLEQVLKHELVHILVGRAFGQQHPPHWLQEGLAAYISGEATPERSQELSGRNPNTLLNFAALENGFPRDPLLARLAYAESGDLVGFLAARHGDAALGRIVKEMAAGETMTSAMRRVTGESPVELEKLWMQRWEEPWGRLPAMAGLVGGVGMTVGAVLAMRRIRRRNQQKLERWEREEQMALHKMAARNAALEQERAWRAAKREEQIRKFQVYH